VSVNAELGDIRDPMPGTDGESLEDVSSPRPETDCSQMSSVAPPDGCDIPVTEPYADSFAEAAEETFIARNRAYLSRMRRFAGVDRAVAYTLMWRGWQILAGGLTILFIARFLTATQQGFYYTFNGILGLQVFFELGLSGVILQFASHERAKLTIGQKGQVDGDAIARCRLASILRTAVGWYAVAACAMVAVVLPVGVWFFGRQASADSVSWLGPWAGIVLFSGLSLFLAPLLSFLQGLGMVSQVAAAHTLKAIAASLLLWVGLIAGFGLHASVLYVGATALVVLIWLLAKQRVMLRKIVADYDPRTTVNWRHEIWPFQWRIAISWLSGYFIWPVINPIVFGLEGPVVAGQMGMSMAVLAGVGTMAISWINTKAPAFGVLVARKDYRGLDRLFFRSLAQSLTVAAVLAGVAWAAICYLNHIDSSWAVRVLPPLPFGILALAMGVNHVVFSEAIYLRAHKREPFLWPSVMLGASNVTCAYVLGKAYGVFGIICGYAILCLVIGLGLGTWIFVTKRREWHQYDPDNLHSDV